MMTLLAINWTNAVIIMLMGFGVVFVILLSLIVILQLFGVIMAPKVRIPKKVKNRSNGVAEQIQSSDSKEVYLLANTSAAIAMALYLYYADVHDQESHVITIKKVERRYSPWSSKIYGINNLVR